jgi:hypothetical protein
MQQGMTPEQAFSYAMALINDRDEGKAKKIIIEIAKRLSKETTIALEAAERASGFKREKDPLKRLLAYRAKSDLLWEEQQMKFPQRWERDWTDYQNLRQRAMEGDFGLMEQAAETMLQAQTDMAVYE